MAKKNRRSFGSIRKLPSGRYQATYVGPSGNRQIAPMTFATKTDADGFLSTVRYKLDRGMALDEALKPARSKTPILGDYVSRHIDLQTTSRGLSLKPSTKALYRKLLRVNLSELVELQLAEITKPRVDEWYAQACSLGKISTASKAYKLLYSAMQRAVGDELIVKNPCSVRGAQSASTGKKSICPSPKQVELIVNQLPERYKVLVLLSAYAGLRFGEVTALRVRNLVFSGSGTDKRFTVQVREAVTMVEKGFVLGTPKSKAGVRDISIPSFLNGFVEKLLADRAKNGVDAFLFVSPSGGFIRNDVLAKALSRAKSRCGLGHLAITPHSFRHFGATQFVASGASFAELKERLGDSSSAAAILYLHPTGQEAKIVEEMPQIEIH
jgi:integrase